MFWIILLYFNEGGAPSARVEAEEAFCLGLNEECPKCGQNGLSEIDIRESKASCTSEKGSVYEIRKAHLKACTDKAAHRAHETQKAKKAAKESEKAQKRSEQDEVQQLATWEFLGADTSQLWLLEDNNLKV